MSHFTVLVIGKDIEEQLAPYDENVMVPRYVEYTKEELIAKERQDIEKYRTNLYAEYLVDPEAYKAKCAPNDAHFRYVSEEFPQKLLWSDEQVYEDALRAYAPEDISPDGEVYSTYNPESHWDWYEIGGRWTGFFKLVPGAKGKLGKPGAFDNHPVHDADQALKKDIDWEGMVHYQHKHAVCSWNKAKNADDLKKYFVYGVEKDDTKESFIKRESRISTYAVVKDRGVASAWQNGLVGFV